MRGRAGHRQAVMVAICGNVVLFVDDAVADGGIWPASRRASCRAGDPGPPERTPEAHNYRVLDGPSAGCIPPAMMPPRTRRCQTKRCRAAAMPPHSNPHPSSTES